MENWLIRVLKDISTDYKISDEKAKVLLKQIVEQLFKKADWF